MEHLSAEQSDIETQRVEHYAAVRAFIAANDRAGLESWLAQQGMASWLVADCGQSDPDVLLSRAFTAVNDWCEVQSGRESLLPMPNVSTRRTEERRRTQAVFS